MSGKQGAYGGASTTTGTERKTWDKEAYAEKAKQRGREHAERAREREADILAGKKPKRRVVNMPKPTKLLEAREAPLELDKNKNKTMIIANGRPGFSCETCKRTLKDSVAYLDHVNSNFHLRMLGQMTKVQRSTLQEVQAKIQELREQSAKKMDAKKYDFEQRLKDIRAMEDKEREERKEQKRIAKERAAEEVKRTEQQGMDPEMMKMMGFAAFE